jgi:hypothetical protein
LREAGDLVGHPFDVRAAHTHPVSLWLLCWRTTQSSLVLFCNLSNLSMCSKRQRDVQFMP